MGFWDAQGYELARQVLQRGTAAVFLVAFVSTLAQFPALLGEHGLAPVPRFLRLAYAKKQPTIFRWHYSDRMLRATALTGAIVAATLVVGLPQSGAPWLPLVGFLLCWALYLSIVNVGQTFYGFGWESLLLEAGFVVAFLGSNDQAPSIAVLFFLRWLVFRLEFGAGMIKMRGGTEWRDLTALYYHHETQPMPNPLSRAAHSAPKWFHRAEVLGNHFAQLVVPWFLFFPQPVASIAGAIIILTQLWLAVTGNFAWLNVLTMILAFSAVSLPTDPVYSATPVWWTVVTLAAVAGLVALSWRPLLNLFSRHQLMNASFNRFHLVNAYGAFGTVTKQRAEVIVEGSTDGSTWSAYEFKGKPGDPTRRPRQFAPYHLRLDWLMWFLALGSPDSRWFEVFLLRLLDADRATLKLLRVDPFHGEAPRLVRARVFLYRFATRKETRESRLWWVREEVGVLVPPTGLPGRSDPTPSRDSFR
jgi:hypothetical protein